MKRAYPTVPSFCKHGKIGVKLAQGFAFVHNGLDDILRFCSHKNLVEFFLELSSGMTSCGPGAWDSMVRWTSWILLGWPCQDLAKTTILRDISLTHRWCLECSLRNEMKSGWSTSQSDRNIISYSLSQCHVTKNAWLTSCSTNFLIKMTVVTRATLAAQELGIYIATRLYQVKCVQHKWPGST